ncbi:MAG: peroxiredoxin family protein [Alteromonadaceae bacterium]|nr:peroxiredoxin family protein [Alteromonadaceae bacterium]
MSRWRITLASVATINFFNKIKFIAIALLFTVLSGCAAKVIAPAEQAKLEQGNYSDLNATFKKLPLGEIVPAFTLPDAEGKQVSLIDLYQDKAVAIIFYRGDWCPYCIDQLGTIAAVLPQIEALGVQVVAITPDKKMSMQNTQRRFSQQFIFLSDPKANVIRQYGVARANNLPHPAVYLVDKGGKLVWFYSSSDYKKRPNGEQLLAVIKSHLHK